MAPPSCYIDPGNYTIYTKDGHPVVLKGDRVYVEKSGNAQVFYFEKYSSSTRCTYVLHPKGSSNKFVDYNDSDWKIDLDHIHRNWTITHITGNEFTIQPSGSIHGWIVQGPLPAQLELDKDAQPKLRRYYIKKA